MGYESRLYVVDKDTKGLSVNMANGTLMRSSALLARFDLSCVGNECNELWSSGKDTDCYVYDCKPDGNRGYITQDCYGKPLTEHSVKDAIRILMSGEVAEHYRRYTAPIAYLMAIDESEWNDIVVLHYGY